MDSLRFRYLLHRKAGKNAKNVQKIKKGMKGLAGLSKTSEIWYNKVLNTRIYGGRYVRTAIFTIRHAGKDLGWN